jgi:prophage regulatory protein
MRQGIPANVAYTLLRLPQVKARTGLSRSEIYRRVSAGTFPAPVKLGERATAWPEHEVSAWCEARIATRDAKAAA